MILDCHIHKNSKSVDKNDFLQRLKAAGVDGGIVLSLRPNSFHNFGVNNFTFDERLDDVMSFVQGNSNLYPFFWIDPLEEDAVEQVKLAAAKGVSGFKVICNNFYPGDKKAMEAFAAIAETKKPLLFHSGILYDGAPSSKYNRPAEFEPLFDIEGLRFALAHVSWPWTDECLAVYGKFQHSYRSFREKGGEMFIDVTPGTPKIYRKDVLTKLFTVGYDVVNNVMFGVDSRVENYNSEYAMQWIERDNEIYKELSLSETIVNNVFSENVKRFIGVTK